VIEIKDGEIVKDRGSRKAPAIAAGSQPVVPDLQHGTSRRALFAGLERVAPHGNACR
jgi:hypothetical protein